MQLRLILLLATVVSAVDFSQYHTCKDCVAAGHGWCPIQLRCGGFANRKCPEEDKASDGEGVEPVLELSSDEFDDVLEGKCAFVEFYAPWCGHCKAMEPVLGAVSEAYKHDSHAIIVAKVDGTVPSAADRFRVSSYPTLRIFANGVPSNYVGARDKGSIVSYINTMCNGDRDVNGKLLPNAGRTTALDDFAFAMVDYPPQSIQEFQSLLADLSILVESVAHSKRYSELHLEVFRAIYEQGNSWLASEEERLMRIVAEGRVEEGEVSRAEYMINIIAAYKGVDSFLAKQLTKLAKEQRISTRADMDRKELIESLRPAIVKLVASKRAALGVAVQKARAKLERLARQKAKSTKHQPEPGQPKRKPKVDQDARDPAGNPPRQQEEVNTKGAANQKERDAAQREELNADKDATNQEPAAESNEPIAKLAARLVADLQAAKRTTSATAESTDAIVAELTKVRSRSQNSDELHQSGEEKEKVTAPDPSAESGESPTPRQTMPRTQASTPTEVPRNAPTLVSPWTRNHARTGTEEKVESQGDDTLRDILGVLRGLQERVEDALRPSPTETPVEPKPPTRSHRDLSVLRRQIVGLVDGTGSRRDRLQALAEVLGMSHPPSTIDELLAHQGE